MIDRQKLTNADWYVYHFSRSTYITVIWNWFMILAGKAAEPFLFASVLYAGYKLLPGVSLPPANVDAVMFVAQMAALDIGGMGLLKIAQQEKLGYQSLAYRVGFILIALMIANVVLATVEHVFTIPADWASGIEACLLIARAVMCVIYGYAVHSLRDSVEHTEQGNTEQPTNEQGVQLNTEHLTAEQVNTIIAEQVNTLRLNTEHLFTEHFNRVNTERVNRVNTEHFGEWVNTEQGVQLNTEHLTAEQVNAAFSLMEYAKVTMDTPAIHTVEPAPPVEPVLPVTEPVPVVAKQRVERHEKPNRTRKEQRPTPLHVVKELTTEQRVGRAYSEHGLSTSIREIARMLNISPATVKKWKEVMEREQHVEQIVSV